MLTKNNQLALQCGAGGCTMVDLCLLSAGVGGMEDGAIAIAKRLKLRGVRPGDVRRLYYITDSFVLSDAENLAEFRADVEREGPSLIVIDTAAEALGIRDWLNRSEIIEKVAP